MNEKPNNPDYIEVELVQEGGKVTVPRASSLRICPCETPGCMVLHVVGINSSGEPVTTMDLGPYELVQIINHIVKTGQLEIIKIGAEESEPKKPEKLQ